MLPGNRKRSSKYLHEFQSSRRRRSLSLDPLATRKHCQRMISAPSGEFRNSLGTRLLLHLPYVFFCANQPDRAPALSGWARSWPVYCSWTLPARALNPELDVSPYAHTARVLASVRVKTRESMKFNGIERRSNRHIGFSTSVLTTPIGVGTLAD